MKNLRRVVWSKGMFLTPQHFQSQDEFFEDSLQFRFTGSNFANWGVMALGIDEESLANGLFRLRYCRGILPDGLLFHMPEADELPQSRPLEEYFPPTQGTLDVFLAIPEHRPHGRNFTLLSSEQADAPPDSTRYLADTEMVPDATAGADEKPVQLGKKTLRLLLEGENRDGFTAMRIAQVSRNAAGKYILNPRFIPPCLDISASEYLMMLLRRQIEVLAAKAGALSQPRRERGRDLADFTTSEVSSYWLLHTINSNLPELKHIWGVRKGHPEPLFVEMLRLAGALSTFALEPSREFPAYDHDNLGFCFSELDGRIRDLLEIVVKSKCVPVPLVLTDKLIWQGTIPDDQYLRNTQFFLSVSSKINVDELITKFPRLAKVSSPNEIQRLIRNSLTGLTLRHAAVPPSAIPLKLDNQYFSIAKTGVLWDGVSQTRNLTVFVPGEIADPKMELLIVLE
jgi:type VI secretion system protein ImpJ